MKITEDQKKAIIADTISKLKGVIDNIDSSDFETSESGLNYNYGSTTLKGEIEEICYEGLPGVPQKDNEIFISAKYECQCNYHDEFEPGDYWTPSYFGIVIDTVIPTIIDIDIDVSIYVPETDDYEFIQVSDEDKKIIIDQINNKVEA